MRHLLGGPLLAAFAAAQVPLAQAPPRPDRLEPAVMVHAELPDDVAVPPVVAFAVDAAGRPIGRRVSAEGDPLPPVGEDFATTWHPAQSRDEAVAGALWWTPPCAFHFELDESAIAPPRPRFTLPRIPAEKFALIARVLEKGIFRAEVSISETGHLESISVWSQELTGAVRDLFADALGGDGPAFTPARRRATGEAVAVQGEFRWDLRTTPPRGVTWETDTIEWDDLVGGRAEIALYVLSDGAGGVQSAYLVNPGTDHPSLARVLLTALVLPSPAEAPGMVERWLLRVQPSDGTVRRIARQPVDFRAPIMLQAPRPEYPRKLWRRGAEGYAYVRYIIGRDGFLEEVDVIEASEEEFADEARKTLALWQFEPMQFAGRPIRSEVIMTLPFRVPPRR